MLPYKISNIEHGKLFALQLNLGIKVHQNCELS